VEHLQNVLIGTNTQFFVSGDAQNAVAQKSSMDGQQHHARSENGNLTPLRPLTIARISGKSESARE